MFANKSSWLCANILLFFVCCSLKWFHRDEELLRRLLRNVANSGGIWHFSNWCLVRLPRRSCVRSVIRYFALKISIYVLWLNYQPQRWTDIWLELVSYSSKLLAGKWKKWSSRIICELSVRHSFELVSNSIYTFFKKLIKSSHSFRKFFLISINYCISVELLSTTIFFWT